MLFDCLQENLSKGLSTVSRFVPPRAQLPILSNILISAKNGELKLGATNLESGINLQIGAKITTDGEIAVPAKTITELISSLSPGKIELETKENNLQITSLTSKATVSCLPAAEFPPFPVSKKEEVKFTKEELSSPVLLTAVCAATDESRPVLSGIKIFAKDEKLNFVATDGYRLSLKSTPIKAGDDFTKGIILPAKILTEIVKILSEDERGEAGLDLSSSGQVVFKLDRAEIFSRLIEGQYPDFEKIIPGSFTTRTVFSRQALAAATRTTAVFARDAANIIKFQINQDKFEISANASQVGNSTSEIEAKTEGEGGIIAFNVRFLQDLLNVVDSEELVFEMTNSLSPGVFKIPGDPSFLHLIMPVRVTE